jgi:two-component system, NarL family, response regulator DegU
VKDVRGEKGELSGSRHVRIVIIEDHQMFRELIRLTCSKEPGYHVVGEADTGATGLATIIKTQPDIAIMDISLPDIDGFQVAEQALRKLPTLRILGNVFKPHGT